MGRHEKHTGGRLVSDEYMQERKAAEIVSGQIIDLVSGHFGLTIEQNERGSLIMTAADMIEHYPPEGGNG